MNNHSANSYEVTERRKMQKVKLGEICKVLNGYAFSSDKYVESGLRIIRITNVQKGYIEDDLPCYYPIEKERELQKFILKENDLLISLTGNVGRVGLLPKKYLPSVLNQRVGCIKVNDENKVNNKYLFHFLNNDKFEVESVYNAKGVAQKNMSTEWLKQQEIPLPPLEEQRAIAEKLDKVSQLVDKRKEQLQQLDQLVKSQFIDMFGDPAIDEDNGDTLGDYFNIVSGGTPDTKNMDYWQNGTIPWIGSSACQNCVIKTVNQKFITQMGLQHSSSKILGAGTVLVALVGATIGKTALLKCETAINQNIAGIKVLENKQFTPQYVFYAMQFLYKKFMEIGGDKFKMANLTFIRGLPFAKQPIVLQNKFAEFVEMVDKLKEKVNSSLTHLNLLKQSLMQQYFG